MDIGNERKSLQNVGEKIKRIVKIIFVVVCGCMTYKCYLHNLIKVINDDLITMQFLVKNCSARISSMFYKSTDPN
jgi:flagellar biosynthesis protein FlhB